MAPPRGGRGRDRGAARRGRARRRDGGQGVEAPAGGGPAGVMGLWSGAILAGGAVEIGSYWRRRAAGSTPLAAWTLRAQGNLSLVAVALSALHFHDVSDSMPAPAVSWLAVHRSASERFGGRIVAILLGAEGIHAEYGVVTGHRSFPLRHRAREAVARRRRCCIAAPTATRRFRSAHRRSRSTRFPRPPGGAGGGAPARWPRPRSPRTGWHPPRRRRLPRRARRPPRGFG